ncbi:MAG TPA: molecular chaperone DnaK [Candidatus Acidoferrales bacterium]|nr:molecular chaperone DnaK [Candidatus Acidoferrales bacterium]
MSKTVGIDLGTTFSLVAYIDAASGQPQCIPDPWGSTLCPSVVTLDQNGKIVVGEPARQLLLTQPERSIYSVKRLMGRGVEDVRDELKIFPFRIDENSRGVIRVRLGERYFTPPEISSFILRELKSWAEKFFNDTVDRAVITVPAYFNDAQRQATKDAGRLAGLEVLRLVNEPTAAALAYGLHKQRRGRVAVYDFGGGTFDISILKLISSGEGDIYQVLSTNGDTHLGGDDIDNALTALVSAEISAKFNFVIGSDPEAAQKLRKVVIHAKHELSQTEETTIGCELPDGRAYLRKLTRAEFDKAVEPIVARTMKPVKMALADAKLKPSEIDEVVLVGGSTRIPLVRKTVGDYFGRAPHVELNPDEVVALGAAVQADILESGVKNMLLLDVTPLSLGIETMGGVVAKLIPRNSTIPASAQELFTTGVENQTGIDIHILQGERELAKDCRSLARFQLKVAPGPAGLARVEVKFLIDANGILQVAARDLRTGEQNAIEVQPSYGLTDSEMEKMLEESIEFAEQDFAERQLIEARNEADAILHATEKTLAREEAQLLPKGERPKIDIAVKALRDAAAGSDYKLIRQKIDELNHATHGLAELSMNKALQAAVGGKRLEEL